MTTTPAPERVKNRTDANAGQAMAEFIHVLGVLRGCGLCSSNRLDRYTIRYRACMMCQYAKLDPSDTICWAVIARLRMLAL